MKKFVALFAVLAISPASAEVLVSDDFPTNGTLTGTTPSVGGIWTSISGTANQIQVVNNRVQLTDAASEDNESGFGTSFTTGSLYFGMDLSVADPGTYTGTDFEYFTHFSGSTFTARTDIAAFSATGYRPGVATTSSTAEAIWASSLSYGTDYRMVVGYDFTTGLTSLWIDPTAITDTSITSTTAVTGITLDAFNFRQSAATPNQDISIGQLRVATTFNEVLLAPPPTIPSLTWYGDGLTPGGSGTWSAAGSNWSDNGGAAGGWDPTKAAVFDTTGGTVTVDGAGVTAETGIDFVVDGYTVTGGAITLGAGGNAVTVADGATATIDSVLTGTVTSFEKAGDGTLILGGANTFVGPASISGGRLQVSSDAALGDTSNGLALAGGTFAPTGSITLGVGRAVSGAGNLDIADGQTLTVNGDYSADTTIVNTGTLDLQGATRNVGSLNFNAAGTVTGAGALTGSGVTAAALTSGTATVVPSIDLGTGSTTVGVGTGATLDLQGGVTYAGTLTKEGGGLLIMGSGSSIDRLSVGRGGFSFTDGGVIRVSEAGALGSNEVFYNYGTVELTAPVTMANGISFGGRIGTEAVIGGAGGNEALTVDGAVRFYGPTATFGTETAVDVNNTTTINGGVTLIPDANITGWTLGGSGTLNLTADSSATFTAPITLTDTVTLNLTGNIGGSVSIADGVAATLGGSGGLLGSLSLGADTQFIFDLTSALTVGDDAATDTVSFGLGFGIDNLIGLDSSVANGTYTIIDGLATFDTTNLGNLGAANAFDLGGGKSAYFTEGSLQVNVVPEPSTYAFLCLAAAGLGAHIVRRRRR
ncbi:MAG: beta strand repeat-containing protein [Kiritimatiellia bacterium]